MQDKTASKSAFRFSCFPSQRTQVNSAPLSFNSSARRQVYPMNVIIVVFKIWLRMATLRVYNIFTLSSLLVSVSRCWCDRRFVNEFIEGILEYPWHLRNHSICQQGRYRQRLTHKIFMPCLYIAFILTQRSESKTTRILEQRKRALNTRCPPGRSILKHLFPSSSAPVSYHILTPVNKKRVDPFQTFAPIKAQENVWTI